MFSILCTQNDFIKCFRTFTRILIGFHSEVIEVRASANIIRLHIAVVLMLIRKIDYTIK